MKACLTSVALAAILLSGLMAPPASAQLFGGGIVYDPSNHAENILQAETAILFHLPCCRYNALAGSVNISFSG